MITTDGIAIAQGPARFLYLVAFAVSGYAALPVQSAAENKYALISKSQGVVGATEERGVEIVSVKL